MDTAVFTARFLGGLALLAFATLSFAASVGAHFVSVRENRHVSGAPFVATITGPIAALLFPSWSLRIVALSVAAADVLWLGASYAVHRWRQRPSRHP